MLVHAAERHPWLCSLLILALAWLLLAVAAPPARAYDGPVGYAQMLVNKDHLLSSDYAGGDLVELSQYLRANSDVQLSRPAAEALGQMAGAMEAAGLDGLSGTSGYRSYSLQTTLHQRKISYYRSLGYGQADAGDYAAQVVAPPGTSEHQTGLAIDVTAGGTGLTESFAQTAEGQWLAGHSWEYGFILRYPQDRTEDTGYIYEPWHFRYVGQPHAEYISKNQLILEDYVELLRQQGVIGMTSSVTGLTYAVYYCQDLAAIDQLPGQLLSVSYATTQRDGYIVTTQADASTLYDIIGHWAEENIRHLVMLDIVTGYTDNTFRPGRNINRAELVTLTARTYRLLFGTEGDFPGYLPYSDVSSGDYYYANLWLCYQRGLLPSSMQALSGQTEFRPSELVLRWEAAQSLAPLFAALPEAPSAGLTFGDMLQASPELRHAVQLLADYGILTGDDLGNFNPDATITRAEICAMLDRIASYFYAAQEQAGEEDAPADPEDENDEGSGPEDD